MAGGKRSFAFWLIIIVFGLSVIMLLLGQTTAVINYDFAVRLGLQESVEEVTQFGMQINRAFGAGDTVVYVPLLIISLSGLLLRKNWAVATTAAVMGMMVYGVAVSVFMVLFLKGAPGYSLTLGVGHWLFFVVYAAFGIWGLFHVVFRGERLIAKAPRAEA